MNCALTTVLAALLTPTIAVLGAYIAYRQWRTAQNRLKFDLFERRVAVYDATAHFISSILSSGKTKDEEDWKFLVATKPAKWLFSQEVAEYLDKKLRAQALELQVLHAELPGIDGVERTANIQQQAQIKKWLFDQYRSLDEIFGPYLRLRH